MIVANQELVERIRRLHLSGYKPLWIKRITRVELNTILEAIRDEEHLKRVAAADLAEKLFMEKEAPALMRSQRRAHNQKNAEQQRKPNAEQRDRAEREKRYGTKTSEKQQCEGCGGLYYSTRCGVCQHKTRALTRTVYGDTGVSAQHLGACVEYPSRMLVHEVSHWES